MDVDKPQQVSFEQDGDSISPLSDRVRQLRDFRNDARSASEHVKRLKGEIKNMMQESGMETYSECGLYITLDDTLKVKSLVGD